LRSPTRPAFRAQRSSRPGRGGLAALLPSRCNVTLVVLLGFAAVMTAGGVLLARVTSHERQRAKSRREIEARPTSAIAALRDGELARIRGVVTSRERLLTSPFGERACVGYRVEIIDGRYEGDEAARVVHREEWPSFLVTDETGTAAVEGPMNVFVDPTEGWSERLPSDVLPASVVTLLKEDGIRLKELFGIARQFRFRETLLKVGERVTVIGRPSIEIDPAGRGFQREPPRLSVLRGYRWEPVVVADDY